MSSQGIADFRSDTVTRPSAAMYEAMQKAPLGDDVFGDDPTVLELEVFAASLFGKKSALFVPSGTMANQIAARLHTDRDSEALVEASAHCLVWEQAGFAQLSGIQIKTIAGRRGMMALKDLEAATRGDNEHWPRTKLLCLENTHNGAGGAVLPLEYLRSCREFADSKGMKVHLDGARLVNAEAATGIALDKWAATADSVSCCLSKGLGAPVGSLLLGDESFVKEARRVRKLFGGGMRQAGILAAAGLVALRDMRARLVDDHRRAASLAEAFGRLPGIEVVAPETNMLYFSLAGRAKELQDGFEKMGVLTLALNEDSLRLVCHLDIDDEHVERAISALETLVKN
ncbi:MAG: low-specificity L-threonine aldolase [Planctomycetota bacterium]